jgi:alanyl-tRNA synthetase
MKVIADHSRAAAFLINDGVLPSNEGRGYVLRRIMRRAIRYGRNIGLARPFLHRTVETVFDIMRPAYPELSEAAPFIRNVVLNEEQRFMETLDTGSAAAQRFAGRSQGPGAKRDSRRSDLQTLRHLRFPGGHRAGCGARHRHGG